MAELFVQALERLNVSNEVICRFIENSMHMPDVIKDYEEGLKEDRTKTPKIWLAFRQLDEITLVGAELPTYDVPTFINDDNEHRTNLIYYLLDELQVDHRVESLLLIRLESEVDYHAKYIKKRFIERFHDIVVDTSTSNKYKIAAIKKLVKSLKRMFYFWDLLTVGFRKPQTVDEAVKIIELIRIAKNANDYKWITDKDAPRITLYQYFDAIAKQYLMTIPGYRQ